MILPLAKQHCYSLNCITVHYHSFAQLSSLTYVWLMVTKPGVFVREFTEEAQENFAKFFQEKFPAEKIQALVDK